MMSDFWIKLIVIGIVTAALSAAGWAAFNRFTETYREEGRAEMRPTIAQLEAKIEELTLALEKQSAAVKSYKAATERRMLAANKAKQQAEQQAATLAERVRQLEAMQPAFPDNPCLSACQLLEDFKL